MTTIQRLNSRISDLVHLKDSLMDEAFQSGTKNNLFVNIAAGYHFKAESLCSNQENEFLFIRINETTYVAMNIQNEAIPYIDRLIDLLEGAQAKLNKAN